MKHWRRGAGPPPAQVLVIGGGLAGLSAAIAARRLGASVRLIESAPEALRGGDARHARNFRFPHAAPTLHTPGAYREDEFLAEWRKAVGGEAVGARPIIAEAADVPEWLGGCGVRLQDPATGVVPFSRRTAFLLGGGKAMVNALYAAAAGLGVEIGYDSPVLALRPGPEGWAAELAGEAATARCVVVASGGPGAHPDWIGPGYAFRGAAYADGRLLRAVIDELGLRTVGDPASRHMVAVDARGPGFDGGIVTRVTAIPYGVVVNRKGVVLSDPARNAKPSHYAEWGPRIAAQPGGGAWLVLDAEGVERADPMALAPVRAESAAGLARALGLDEAALAGVRLKPPLFGLPLRAGITFAHFGLAADGSQRLIGRDGRVLEGLFGAGMVVAANVLPRGYLAGLGITLSVVTGRRAGEAAARHVLG